MSARILPPRKRTAKKFQPGHLTLSQYTDKYFASRTVTRDYEEKTRAIIRCFIDWYGSDPPVADLNCDVANEWLTALLETDMRPETANGYRRALRCVWMFAYEERDNDNPPFRLKKIRVPRESVEAYTHQEIEQLLRAAAEYPGYFAPNGVRRSVFWTAMIHAAYSTGLRRGDLLRMRRSDITDDGIAIICQHKTGYRVAVRFSPQAMGAIGKMRCENSTLALPWPYHEQALSRQFRELVRAAGVGRGSFKWLRRSAGSYAEAANPGAGHRALGHRTLAVFNGHYNDERISVSQPVAPPPIEGKTEARVS